LETIQEPRKQKIWDKQTINQATINIKSLKLTYFLKHFDDRTFQSRSGQRKLYPSSLAQVDDQ